MSSAAKPRPGTRPNRQDSLSQSLVGAWLFGEGGGGVVHDASRQGLDGEIQGTPNWALSQTGPCLNLNGSTNALSCGTLPHSFAQGLSVCAQFTLNSTTPYQTIISSRVEGGTTPFSLDIDQENYPRAVRLYLQQSGYYFIFETTTNYALLTALNTLVVSYTPGTGPVCLLNGLFVPMPQTNLSGAPAVNYAPNPLSIGWFSGAVTANGDYPLDGLLCNVGLWGRPLTAAEMLRLDNDPWRLFRTKRKALYGAAAGATTGSAPGGSTATGLALGGVTTGTAPGSSTATGLSPAVVEATGTAPGGSTATGVTPSTDTAPPYATVLRYLYAPRYGAYRDTAQTTPCTDGTTCLYLRDQSGNHLDLGQPTSGLGATYNVNQINGLPALTFNGASQYYYFVGSGPFQCPGRTVFAVINSTKAGTGAIVSGNPYALEFRLDDLKMRLVENQVADLGSATTAVPGGTWTQINASWDGTTGIFRQAGAANGTVTAGSPPQALGAACRFVGATQGPSLSEYFNGSLALLMEYSGVLTTASGRRFESWITSVWGV